MIERITIASDELVVEIAPLGAALASVRPVEHGAPGPNLVLAPGPAGDGAYRGVIAGRFANRIGRARFELDGSTVMLDANDGVHCLHGGPEGFGARRWKLIDGRDDWVSLALHSPAGDQGFPGAVDATATYRVRAASIEVELAATSDAPTVVSLTNHAYWNLDGWDEAATIDDHEFCIDADAVVAVDADLVPTGALVGRSGAFGRIGARSLDLSWCRPDGRARGVYAELISPRANRSLRVRSDLPAVQVYTGDHLGAPHGPRAGLAIEAQLPPDAPNHPEWWGWAGTPIVRPGETWRHTTTFELSRTTQ